MAKKLESEILKDLPVNTISDDVINNVTKGVQIVSSPTGSGKTLTIPTKWADRLPEGERVVVLVPRRFLAINAAETVAELSDTRLGEEVGYAVGTQGGDEPLYGKNSKVVFMTYGYAISSGALMYEKNIVLDEVHESSMDISIVKAILQNRKKEDDNLNLIEMSATIDLDKQVNYWNEFNPTAHQCEGKTFDCEIIEENEKSEAEMAIELIQDHGRKGIAIFQSGKREIEDVAEELSTLLDKKKIYDVEIASIYGEMDSQERRKALAAPTKGKKKIIIGTNVIESGMNIPWLDAGISSGKGKGLYATASEAVVLKEDNLPQWRLQQQKGRVCRFTDGIFVLAADTPWADRPVQTVAEISRLPLTELVLSCAKFGLKTEDLHFDAQIDSYQLAMAKKKLLRLKLIDSDNKITDLGKYVTNLPVSPETGLVLKYAQSREYCLPQAIVLAGVLEQGTLRQSFNWSHDQNQNSDTFDELLAFVRVEKELAELRKRSKFKLEMNKNKTFAQKLKEKEKSASELEDEAISYPKREEIFKKYNVSKKRFYEARESIKDLSKRFKIRVDLTDDNFDFDKLKQCLMAGSISKLHLADENIFDGNSYRFSQSSVLSGNSLSRYLATSKVITPRNGKRPFTILENVTGLSENDLKKFVSKNMDLISDIDSDGDFKILDSRLQSDSAIKNLIKEHYEQEIKTALAVLDNEGVENFKAYAQRAQIPERFWISEIGKSETTAEDAAKEVLGLPQQEKNYNLHEILGIKSSDFNDKVRITEDFLRENGLIENNQLTANIKTDYPIVFEIYNPDLSANFTLIGEESHRISFEDNKFKNLTLESNNPGFDSAISLQYTQAEKIEFNHVTFSELKATYSRAKTLIFNDTHAKFMEFDNSATKHLVFNGGSLKKLDIYSMDFAEIPAFNNIEVENIKTGSSTTLNGSPLYFIKGEKGYFASDVSEETLQRREYERLQEIQREAERVAEQRAEDIGKIKEAIAAQFEKELRLNSNEEIITSIQTYLMQNSDNLPVKPSLEEIGQIKNDIFEQRQQQIKEYTDALENKKKEIEDTVNLHIQEEENKSGLIISSADLGKFIDDTYREDALAQEVASAIKRSVLLETEDRRAARDEEVNILLSIYYDAVAEEITDVNGEIIRSAGESNASRRRLYDELSEQAEFEEIRNWTKINITGFKPQPGADLFIHNLNFIEKNYVVPDIERNGDVYDSDECYFGMNREAKMPKVKTLGELEEKERLKAAKKQAKQQKSSSVDVSVLAGAWGATLFKSKGKGK